jgi:hypothetical protein
VEEQSPLADADAGAGHLNQRGQARPASGAGIWAARGEKSGFGEAAAAALRRSEAWVAMGEGMGWGWGWKI